MGSREKSVILAGLTKSYMFLRKHAKNKIFRYRMHIKLVMYGIMNNHVATALFEDSMLRGQAGTCTGRWHGESFVF